MTRGPSIGSDYWLDVAFDSRFSVPVFIAIARYLGVQVMTDKVTLVVVGDADVGKSALAVRVSQFSFLSPSTLLMYA